jgi:hypothetical protein
VSDFALSSTQRRRLLDGSFGPLEFDVKPHGCVEGAVYVLAWRRGWSVVCEEDSHVIRVPRHPVWWLTVKSVKRVRNRKLELVWRVQFDVTDRRDPDVWLRRGGGYQTTRAGSPDPLPVAPSDEVRARAQAEFWHQRRLAAHAQQLREQARAKRARKRAA